jgi:hypothetical protein
VVGGWWLPYPSEKYDEVSVGMMPFPMYRKIKAMFQTTNQMRRSSIWGYYADIRHVCGCPKKRFREVLHCEIGEKW